MPLIFTKVIAELFPIVPGCSLRCTAQPVNGQAACPGVQILAEVESLLADEAAPAARRDLPIEALVAELPAVAHGVLASE